MASTRKVPLRKCVGCGEMKPKKELIRVVRCEDGNFVLDATGKKNGRGAYICNSGDCLGKAVKRTGAFFQTGDPAGSIRTSGKGDE